MSNLAQVTRFDAGSFEDWTVQWRGVPPVILFLALVVADRDSSALSASTKIGVGTRGIRGRH